LTGGVNGQVLDPASKKVVLGRNSPKHRGRCVQQNGRCRTQDGDDG
jgi:hypothetical protein